MRLFQYLAICAISLALLGCGDKGIITLYTGDSHDAIFAKLPAEYEFSINAQTISTWKAGTRLPNGDVLTRDASLVFDAHQLLVSGNNLPASVKIVARGLMAKF